MQSMSQRILLDTDIGTDVDDAITLAFLLASPELDLRAVTTVSGDTALRARIAAELLRLGGRSEIAVGAGIREPILRQRSFLWLGHEGRAIVDEATPVAIAATHGVDLFIETVLRQRPHVVAIGPLSNLAVAIMKEPAVIEAIPHLTLMGGALGRDPDVPTHEYNLASDAEASQLVLNAGIPTTIVPLDVTLKVFFTTDHLARLRTRDTPLLRPLSDAIEIWAELQKGFFNARPGFRENAVSYLHDPLTAAILVEPSLVRRERIPLRAAVIDGAFRLIEEKGAPLIDVAVEVDAPRAVDFILGRLLSLP